jgi:geranylgeranyl reductase family protein
VTERVFDVAVVGAGPAGATLARKLAEGGARVVLLERARLPRYKPCGGGLTRRALRQLPPAALELVLVRPTAAQVVFGGRQVRVRAPAGALGMVMRDAFDHRLAQLAVQAGAELREGAPLEGARVRGGAVELIAAGEPVAARWVAFCDGSTGPSSGPVGAALGLGAPPPRIGALEAELEDPGAAWGTDLRGDFDLVPGGYGWVFPKAGVLSVGVACWRPGQGGARLRGQLEAYVHRLGLGGRRVLRRHGHPIPVGGRLPWDRLFSEHAIRVGDAAGLADPLFGEGIAHALESGGLAAAALLAGDPESYARAVRAGIYRRFALAQALAGVFYPAPSPWFVATGLLPSLGDRFFALALGGSDGAPAV